jgi:hypothetical protein
VAKAARDLLAQLKTRTTSPQKFIPGTNSSQNHGFSMHPRRQAADYDNIRRQPADYDNIRRQAADYDNIRGGRPPTTSSSCRRLTDRDGPRALLPEAPHMSALRCLLFTVSAGCFGQQYLKVLDQGSLVTAILSWLGLYYMDEIGKPWKGYRGMGKGKL